MPWCSPVSAMRASASAWSCPQAGGSSTPAFHVPAGTSVASVIGRLADTWRQARTLLDKTIAGCLADDVPEIVSLGKTLRSWRNEILAHHTTGASNGPTEGLNLCVKKVKRCGHGFRTFEHYRLRVLLHAGGVTWPSRPQPTRIRTRAPHAFA